MARPCIYDHAELDEGVYLILRDVAARGDRAPSLIEIGRILHRRKDTIGGSIKRLDAAGRIQIRGARNTPSYFIPETGRETTRVRAGRPPTSDTVKRDGALTSGQRQVLAVARQLDRQGVEICAANIGPKINLPAGAALSRLTRLAGNGYLRPLRPGYFALVDAEQRKREEPQPIVDTVEIDGRQVRRTRYPAMLADGACQFGCGLGRGSVALAGGGAQVVARRA